jgi:hypothetical protein
MTNPYDPTTRVNARIDRVSEEQLRYVTEHTRMNVTEALRTSIALMYDKVSREHEAPIKFLRRHGFIGMAASGANDISENTKREIVKSLTAKSLATKSPSIKPLAPKIKRRAHR